MAEHVLHANHPLGERSALLINKLMRNPEFHNYFMTRAADLLNTSLSTSNVLSEIDSLTAEIEPDFGYEKDRWSITADWGEKVQQIRSFAQERPDIMREQFVESFGLGGTTQLRFEPAGGGSGWIVINDLPAQPLPWQGIFFKGTDIRLRAIPGPGYQFAGWEASQPLEESDSSVIAYTVSDEATIRPHFIPLPESAWQPGDVTIRWPFDNDGGGALAGLIEGPWIEMQVNRQGGADIRGLRLTDNDSLMAMDEGSLIFANDPILADIPRGSTIIVVTTETTNNALQFPEDEWRNGRLILYVGNDLIDTETDPWFKIGQSDNLVLLAPGSSDSWHDDSAIDFVGRGDKVRATDFGLLPANAE